MNAQEFINIAPSTSTRGSTEYACGIVGPLYIVLCSGLDPEDGNDYRREMLVRNGTLSTGIRDAIERPPSRSMGWTLSVAHRACASSTAVGHVLLPPLSNKRTPAGGGGVYHRVRKCLLSVEGAVWAGGLIISGVLGNEMLAGSQWEPTVADSDPHHAFITRAMFLPGY